MTCQIRYSSDVRSSLSFSIPPSRAEQKGNGTLATPKYLTSRQGANKFSSGEKIRYFIYGNRDAQRALMHLTRRESQIMEIVHRRQRATVEEIRSELPHAPTPSSVRKLLDIMIERGLLAREYDGPRHVYYPAVAREDASRSAILQLVTTFFKSSPSSAIAALLDVTEKLSEEEYARLSAHLKQLRQQGETR